MPTKYKEYRLQAWYTVHTYVQLTTSTICYSFHVFFTKDEYQYTVLVF